MLGLRSRSYDEERRGIIGIHCDVVKIHGIPLKKSYTVKVIII